MKTTIFEDIHVMHHKFGITYNLTQPTLLPFKDMEDRIGFIQEELDETQIANSDCDLEEVIDGLIDIIVVAAGTLDLMGVDGQKHWEAVRRANMDKERGHKPGRDMKFDLVKPYDWIPPRHDLILEQYKK